MKDAFDRYEAGLKRLLEPLDEDHPDYNELLILQMRLRDNILDTRRYGETDTLKHDRARILDALDRLSREATEVAFSKLCGPYPPIPCFVHRPSIKTEEGNRTQYGTQFAEWLESRGTPLLVVVGASHTGKTALAWNWANTIAVQMKNTPEGLFWWSFRENSSFIDFLREAITYFSAGQYRTDCSETDMHLCGILLERLETSSSLLILDGFERLLKAYSSFSAQNTSGENNEPLGSTDLCQCISPAISLFLKSVLLSSNKSKSKVLLTSRLLPQVLIDRVERSPAYCQILRFPGGLEDRYHLPVFPLRQNLVTILRTLFDLDLRTMDIILNTEGLNSLIALFGIQASHRRLGFVLNYDDFARVCPFDFFPLVHPSTAAPFARTLIRTADFLDSKGSVGSVYGSLFDSIDWSNLGFSSLLSLLELFFRTAYLLFDWRVLLVKALGQLRVEEASSFLARQLESRRPRVRRASALALCYTGQNLEATWTLVERLSSDRKAKVRAACAEALGYSNSTRPVDALIDSLDDPHEQVRYKTIESLGWIGDRKAYNVLMSKSEEWSGRVFRSHFGASKPMSIAAQRAAEQIKQREIKGEESPRLPPDLPPEIEVSITIAGAGLAANRYRGYLTERLYGGWDK